MTANDARRRRSGNRPGAARSRLTAQGASASVGVGIVREVGAPGIAAADGVAAHQGAGHVNPDVKDQAEEHPVVGVDAILRVGL